MSRRKRQRGSTLLEFTLAGIPMIFVWISVVQMAAGMWDYASLQYAVRAAGAYTAVHGYNCTTCKIRIQDAAQVVRSNSPGLSAQQLTLTFQTMQADHVTPALTVAQCTLDQCLVDSTQWPPAGSNQPGKEIVISAVYQFRSALAMYAPGGGSTQFGTFNLRAYTHQAMQF